MSRHKLIKNLNIDDELDDYDGGEDYIYSSEGEGLSEEDQERLAITTIAVRASLPPSLDHITDNQIHDSLWHTYYDVDKTAAYLVKAFTLKVSKPNNDFAVKPIKDTTNGNPMPFSFQEFFKDTPWLNIPTNRQTTFIAPLSLRGGLLGGSGSSEPPKMSKLQTLAANRKKMAQQQKSGNLKNSEGSLNKLHLSLSKQESASGSSDHTPKQIIPRSFPIRKRRVSNPIDPALISFKKDSKIEDLLISDNTLLNIAKPSEFANTLFRSIPPDHSRQHFKIPCPINNLTTDPFAEPSPDDIVLAAQSKGLRKSNRTVRELGN